MMFELLFLFLAGFFGGTLNSIAGGGTFITFPALLFVGVPPVIANAQIHSLLVPVTSVECTLFAKI